MDEHQAHEEIALIRTMLDKTRRATAESGTLFIVWGILITLALIGDYVLAYFKKYNWEWAVWVAMAVVGWVYSVAYGVRKERKDPVRTYLQTAARHLYFACGAGFILVGLIFPAIGVYSYEAIVVLISAMTGVLFFVMGGIFEWTFLKVFGLLWWAGAIGMSFASISGRTFIYTGLFIVAFLVPAFMLRAKYRRDQARL
jgi:hypothetical protein